MINSVLNFSTFRSEVSSGAGIVPPKSNPQALNIRAKISRIMRGNFDLVFIVCLRTFFSGLTLHLDNDNEPEIVTKIDKSLRNTFRADRMAA